MKPRGDRTGGDVLHPRLPIANSLDLRIGKLRLTVDERTLALFVLWASLLAGFAIRVLIVFTDEGIYWPDEIYQSFEVAHRLVFGYGLVPWEFAEGARNWALPGFVAGVLELCAFFGGDSPFVYVRAVKLVFALASVCTAIGVFRLAKTFGAKDLLASVFASCYALCTLCLYFSHRAMSENAAALPVVWGLALLFDKHARVRSVVTGASLLGISVLFRIQSVLFCACALVVLLARRDWKRALFTFAVLSGWAVAYGGLDALTWGNTRGAIAGGWFHSALTYLRFNLVEGRAAEWGTSPWWYYLFHSWSSMPLVAIILVTGAALAWKRATGLLFIAIAFVVVHSAVPHKELRFIVPVLPVLFAVSAVGFSRLPEIVSLRIAPPAVLAIALFSAFTAQFLTFENLGAYPEKGAQSAWDFEGDVNRLLLEASRHGDLCGIRIDEFLAWTGGSTYLHINAPLYSWDMDSSDRVNYAIVREGLWAQVVRMDKGLMLVRLPDSPCVPDPDYTWNLP